MLVAIIFAQPIKQQVIASSGSYYENGSISLSTTVGEPVITTLIATNNTLTQGFQQPVYDIGVGVIEAKGKALQIKVFPNPTESTITIDLVSDENESAQLMVVDMLGKVLHQQKLSFNTPNAVNLNQLASGQYAFKITDSKGTLLSTHQVQKIK